MLICMAAITVTVVLERKPSNPFEHLPQLASKAEVRATVGRPDKVDVLRRTECWLYGPRDYFAEAKICFGERGRVAWLAYSPRERRHTQPPSPPPRQLG
jgi:hypothetical protein